MYDTAVTAPLVPDLNELKETKGKIGKVLELIGLSILWLFHVIKKDSFPLILTQNDSCLPL